jgi:hypothetical protein
MGRGKVTDIYLDVDLDLDLDLDVDLDVELDLDLDVDYSVHRELPQAGCLSSSDPFLAGGSSDC